MIRRAAVRAVVAVRLRAEAATVGSVAEKLRPDRRPKTLYHAGVFVTSCLQSMATLVPSSNESNRLLSPKDSYFFACVAVEALPAGTGVPNRSTASTMSPSSAAFRAKFAS